jgi:hypothetical protein
VLEQLANPLGVFNIGLPAGDVLEMPSVKKSALEAVFEQVVDARNAAAPNRTGIYEMAST